MKSELKHDEFCANVNANGEMSISGFAPFNMIVRIDCQTGICGEGWSEWKFIPKGIDIDVWAGELAVAHAESYGHGCDPEEDEETGYSEDNISCEVYWYNPSISCDYINGGNPNSEILEWLSDEGLLSLGYLDEITELLHIRDESDITAFFS